MISALLAEAHERGFRLNNLFEHDSGLWQANLRSDTHATDFGYGETPEAALTAAIDAIATAMECPQWQVAPAINTDHLPEPTGSIDIFALLSANLRPHTANPFRGKL